MTPRSTNIAGFAVVALVVVALLVLVSPAAGQAPWWGLTARAIPTSLTPGGEGKLVVVADNLGDGPASAPLTLRDQLPPGVTASGVSLYASFFVLGGSFDLGPSGSLAFLHLCTASGSEVLCTFPGVGELAKLVGQATAEQFSPPIVPFSGQVEMVVTVQVAPGTDSGGENRASATGAGASAESSGPLQVGQTPVQFGLEEFALVPEAEGGTIDRQAGSHPFQLTAALSFAQTAQAPYQPAQPKDVRLKFPPGLIGNPNAVAQCTYAQFSTLAELGSNLCPPQTAIGVVTMLLVDKSSKSTFVMPLFNLTPAAGEPARFGFDAETVPVTLDVSVRTGEDYGVTVEAHNLSQLLGVVATRVTIWGSPANPLHDVSRGWGCLDLIGACGAFATGSQTPFLTLPTSCSQSFLATAEADSWTRPDEFATPLPYVLHDRANPGIQLDGCSELPFAPRIEAAPDVAQANRPTGFTVRLRMPEETEGNPQALAESDLRQARVTLPAGVAVDPASAGGLESCSEAQVGYLALPSKPPDELRFTAEGEFPFCPDASKIGTAEVHTPLLAEPLQGSVYLATQNANPFGTLMAIYLVARDPVAGMLLKLAGEVALDEADGQLTVSFPDVPPLPFADVQMHFFDGQRAALSTPAGCGLYASQASLMPWSGGAPATPSSTFTISSGAEGSPCPVGTAAFTPALRAGMRSAQAGVFSPLTLSVSRPDGDQQLRGVQVRMPPGVSAVVSSVPLCAEGQADAGTCPAASLIGHASVAVGLGGEPFTVQGGQVFLTGPYDGAPYGLSISDSAKAGPFDLGMVVVRAKIEVDSSTGALTITTDPSGPHAIPTILDGVPLQIKQVNVIVDRPGFTFNPTDCRPLSVAGSVTGDQGAVASISTPFGVTGCAALGFKSRFQMSVSSKTSRQDGAYVKVAISYQQGAFGSQANVAKVKVYLPKQLPSRLGTLQKACTDKVFDANPAACPPASRVGEATAKTSILSSPIAGPAYFVSHGGAQFPELVIVLQGAGITVELHGETFISKAGVTSSTFGSVPDLPIGQFELELPSGPNSALAANTNLCTSRPTIRTVFVAQNGARENQTEPVRVTGCKPQIAIVSSRVAHRMAMIVARVPSAGRLRVSGTGLSASTKQLAKAGLARMTLRLTARERSFLAGHPGRRLQVQVRLRFTPLHGTPIFASTTVLIG